MTCQELQSGYELYVFGTLDWGLRAELEAHLARRCVTCVAAVEEARRLAAHLALAPQSEQPSPELRARVLRGAGAQVWKRWEASAAPLPLWEVRANEGAWEPTSVAGVSVKRLFVDAAHDRVTMLVRMAAGATYPRHRHAGPEECFVLEGDLHLPDTVLHAGDYQRAEADSAHGLQWTENGCLLFIVSSLRDQIEA